MSQPKMPRQAACAVIGLLVLLTAWNAPVVARTDYVQDGAQLFSPATVSSLDARIANFSAQTGKEIVVVTVPSLDGQTPEAAAANIFAQQDVNGILIFLAKAERVQGIVPDRAASAFFPHSEIESIRQAMRGYFRAGDFDGGITTGVSLILAQYRSHVAALGRSAAPAYAVPEPSRQAAAGGSWGWFWLILILIAGFLVIRAVFRAMAGPRMVPPGYGPGAGPGYGGGGYGGPWYGGYGGGYGGGGFFSGLLGGLGGAFLGNELFGHQNFGNVGATGVQSAGLAPGDVSSQTDAAGWQNDAGQADMGNASFGDFGGGGSDFGGGDFGGGGDAGGGW